MKKIVFPVMAAFVSLLAFTVIVSTWKVKSEESEIKFSSKKINGTFKGLKADIVFDKEHPEDAKFSATIDATTFATGFFLKNMHGKDALGVDTYPTIKFVSTSVSKNAADYSAKGNLTMKGVTRPAVIHFTFEDKGNQGLFRGNLKVIPKEFGIDRSGTPDEVTIDLVVPVTKS